VRGRVGALLEVGTGFHADLTGRENVFLYGAILGMPRDEVQRKFDAIVDFSGIARFIDTPVKRYSSGMYVRLAFAVAAHLEPDILLLDEVLAVGDLPFQRKCMDFAKKLQQRNATILFVSHNMFSIKTMCARVLYLKAGRVHFDGPTDEAIRIYEDDCRLSTLPGAGNRPDEWPIDATEFEITDDHRVPRTVFDFGERMRIRFRYHTRRPLERPNFVVSITRSDAVDCCRFSTELDDVPIGVVDGSGEIELRTPPLTLVAELYTVTITVRERGWQRVLRTQIGSTFHVRHPLLNSHFGVFHEPGQWTVDADTSAAPDGAKVIQLRVAGD
jgi:lipopolysaccharide transport system ATP-binding protein